MTSATKAKTVELYGAGQQHEATALGNITPGMLIERAAGGVRAHSTAAGPANSHFANEYGITGLGIDDVYETGDNVIFTTYTNGSGVNALLSVGENAAEGAMLVSAGDGNLDVFVAATGGTIIAQALEAVNNSAGVTAARIRVEVMPATYVAPTP